MSDNIDIPIEASGDDGVNRLTSAIDRLTASMEELGNSSAASNLAKQMQEMQAATNTALGALTQQMQDIKQVLATGFADISATNQKLIGAMGDSQARGLKEAGDKAAEAVTEGNAKISAAMRADAATLLQASRGISSNVEQAFALMFVGVSPETVREHFGKIATEAAQGIKSIEDMMQFRANAKSVKATGYDPMAGATEAEIDQARALNAKFDAERLAAQERLGEAMAAATLAELERIDTIQLKRNESARQELENQYKRGEAMAAATVAELERIDTIQMKRNEAEIQARAAQERLGESMAAATVAELERIDTIQLRRNEAEIQARAAQERLGESMAAATLAELERIDTIQLRRNEAEIQAREAQERLGEAMAAATLAELERIDTIQLKRNESARQELENQYRLGEAMAAATVAELERIDTIQMKRDEEVAQARSAQERLGEVMAAAAVAEMERIDTIQMKRREATQQAIEDEYRRGEAMAAATVAELERIDTIKLRRHEAAMQAIEDEKLKNASYMTASPTSQLHTQIRAVGLREEGLDAAQFVGPKAAADAAGKSIVGLRAELRALKAVSADAGAAQYGLTGALRQAESAFKGAAHEAGVYGLAHGQLIALLAGGALAAALHHIAETGAEVQFQLASLNAFSGSMQPIDVDKFIGITAGSMTSLKDAAEGVHALAQAGMDQAQAFSALPNVMRLASLGEMSVAQAAEMAVESMHAFGKGVNDLGEIGDILVAVGTKSNVSVHKLAEDMKSAATMGEMLGMTMEETAAAVGTLAERGLTIQPLSSAMLKLYEPSDKASKVIKQLHLEVKDASTGAFRPFSDILTDLSAKLATFSSSGATDTLKSMGFSSRDIKAMQAMTQHLDDYQHLLHEAEHAQGKMFDAMLVKEDTVKGAWERLGSTLEGTLVKGFENASPVIRQVEDDLMRMAGSGGAVELVTGLATGFARLTQVLVENAGILGTVVAGYVALKAISGLTTLTVEFTVAEIAATRAVETQRVATAAAGTQLSLFAVEEEAAAAGAGVLETRLAAGAAGARLFAAGFGWIAIAATAAIAAYELLSGRLSDVDSKYQTVISTSNTTIDAYDREIERLREMNYQLEHVGTNAQDAGGKLALVGLQSQKSQIEMSLLTFDSKMDAYHAGKGPNPIGWSMTDPRKDMQSQLDQVNDAIAKLGQKQATMDAERSKNSLLTDAKKISDELFKIPLADDMSSKLGIKDPAVVKSLQDRRKELQFTVVTEENHAEVLGKVKALEEDINAAKSRGITAPAGDKDAARVRIEQAQEELRLAQERYKVNVDDLKSQNRRGELGDLQLINKELAEKQALDKVALDMAKVELAAAGPLKPGQRQRYQSRIDSAAARLGPDGLDAQAAERQRLDALDKMDTEELQARAKALTSKGQLEDAYLMNWEAKYGATMARLSADIEAAEGTQYEGRLKRFRDFLEDQRRLGANDARFKEAKGDFGAASAELSQRLNYLKLQSGPGTALGSQLMNMSAQRDTYGEMLPQMQAAQNRVQSLSSVMYSGPDAKEKLKEAKTELAEIQSQMAAMRNTAVAMGEAIAKALTDAYGKGGAALGGMIVAATAYDTKTKEIQATLDASGNTEADRKKAADDAAMAQVKSYGDMAGAAKGFFDTNSNGYKIMAATEKAFRVFELVEAGAALVKKQGFKAAEVTTTVAGDAVKTTSGTAAAAADVANAGASSSAWGITAVVRAIASMPFPLNLAAGAATLAAVVAVGAKIAGSFGGGSDTTAQDRQAANGTGTIAGDPAAKSDSIAKSLARIDGNTYDGLNVSQGMLSALQSIESNIGSFAGLLMQSAGFSATGTNIGLSSGIGASIPLVGHLLSSIFGGKQTLSDTGFMMNASTLGQVASQGVNAKTYADITTAGGWFSSDSHDTKTTDLTAQVNQQIAQIITGIGSTIKTAASILGLSGSQFDQQLNNFVVDIGKISLKGLSSADQQTAINNAFSKLGDQMATAAISTVGQFSKAGEGALETLTRIATDYQTVDAVFASFGTTFSQVGIESIGARENLINLAGGLSKFTSQAEYLLKNFFTQGQQTAALHTAIDPTLAKYGLSATAPNALQQFANVTLAFGKMGDAGAAAYTELMNIAPAFKSIADASSDLQNQLNQLILTQTQQDAITRAALDPTNQGLFDQVQQAKLVSKAKADLVTAYQSESQSIQSTIDKMKSFSLSLRAFINSLQLGNLSPLNPADRYGAAMAQFNDTLAKAKSGDVTAQGNLQSAAQAFLTASRDANASNSTYQADYARVVASTGNMADWADSQASTGQANLIVLHDQVNKLVDIRSATMTVADAINNLAVTMSAGKSTETNTSVLASLYQEQLGRTPDAAGLAFWQQKLQEGVPLSDIIDGFKHSTEYADHTNTTPVTSTVTPSTGFGTATVPTTPVVSAPSPTLQIDTLYEQIFGRVADAAGEAFWVGQLQNGTPLSAIADAMKQSVEYASPATTATSAVVTPPAPVTQAPVVDNSNTSTPDPYSSIVASNSQVVAQLAAVNASIAQLREEQQVQADQQISATMSAGANTGADVADAITTTSQAAAWAANNIMELR